ncbi:basic proline-rich protein-like [Lynx rufus]|uniref:basic proline-rich protein-like n=1 Tax=Lynx rufus TaxID=61384 RepID=UPI001F1240D8|nr:basic proline-rich protein-like [Lynx rufus]
MPRNPRESGAAPGGSARAAQHPALLTDSRVVTPLPTGPGDAACPRRGSPPGLCARTDRGPGPSFRLGEAEPVRPRSPAARLRLREPTAELRGRGRARAQAGRAWRGGRRPLAPAVRRPEHGCPQRRGQSRAQALPPPRAPSRAGPGADPAAGAAPDACPPRGVPRGPAEDGGPRAAGHLSPSPASHPGAGVGLPERGKPSWGRPAPGRATGHARCSRPSAAGVRVFPTPRSGGRGGVRGGAAGVSVPARGLRAAGLPRPKGLRGVPAGGLIVRGGRRPEPFPRFLESKVRGHARCPSGRSLARVPHAPARSPPTPPARPAPPAPRPPRTPGAADRGARRAGPARAADWACSAARRLAVASRKRSHQRGSGPAAAAAAATGRTERAGPAGKGCGSLAHGEPAGERDPAAEPRRCPAPDFGARRGARRAEFRRQLRLRCKARPPNHGPTPTAPGGGVTDGTSGPRSQRWSGAQGFGVPLPRRGPSVPPDCITGGILSPVERAADPRPQNRLQVRGRPPPAEGELAKAWRSRQRSRDWTVPPGRGCPRERGVPATPRRLVKGRAATACGPRRGLSAAGGPGWASWCSQRIQAGAFWLTPVSLPGAASLFGQVTFLSDDGVFLVGCLAVERTSPACRVCTPSVCASSSSPSATLPLSCWLFAAGLCAHASAFRCPRLFRLPLGSPAGAPSAARASLLPPGSPSGLPAGTAWAVNRPSSFLAPRVASDPGRPSGSMRRTSAGKRGRLDPSETTCVPVPGPACSGPPAVQEEERLADVEEAAGMGAKGNLKPSRGGGGSGRDGLRARSLPAWLLFRSRHNRLVSYGCVHMSCSARRTGRGSDIGEGFPVGTGQERHSLPQSPFRPGQAPSLAGVPGALMHLPGPALRAEIPWCCLFVVRPSPSTTPSNADLLFVALISPFLEYPVKWDYVDYAL